MFLYSWYKLMFCYTTYVFIIMTNYVKAKKDIDRNNPQQSIMARRLAVMKTTCNEKIAADTIETI